MYFEWDENKNQRNIEKHKISFPEAARIFTGTGPLLSYDTTQEGGTEKRTLPLGELEEVVVIAVVHTDRRGVTRIILARVASRNERRMFHEYCKSKG